jgi:hypothetical protein
MLFSSPCWARLAAWYDPSVRLSWVVTFLQVGADRVQTEGMSIFTYLLTDLHTYSMEQSPFFRT